MDGESYSDWELLTDHDSEKDDDEEDDANEIPTIKSVEEELKFLKKELKNLSVEVSGFCKSDEVNHQETDNLNADEEKIIEEEEEKENQINNKLIINLGNIRNIR